MPKICYVEKNFRGQSLDLIYRVNGIIDEYAVKGYELTLRQVYYQLVARDIIPNNERSYKNLGNLISDGRLGGLIDWNAIIDRTRNLRGNNHWSSPESIISACAEQYAIDKWAGQDHYVEVWVEKDALVGVVARACEALDVSYFSCRGYVSQSEMWVAGQRLQRQASRGRMPVVLHLGDHDPSGQDMSRDIQDRLELFGVPAMTFERLALNMDQIEAYNPPPNPTKPTDSRSDGNIDLFGLECWELDALKPEVINDIITSAVLRFRDEDRFRARVVREQDERAKIALVSDNWAEAMEYLETL